MVAALPIATLQTSSELFALLRKVDPSSFRDESEPEARAELARIVAAVESLSNASHAAANDGKRAADLDQRLSQLAAALDRAQHRESESPKSFWTAFVKEVHPHYEALAAWLRRESLPAKSLRPTNYSRSLFHVASGVVAFVVLLVAPSRGWVIGASSLLCATAWFLEIWRRFSPAMNDKLVAFFGKVAHPHERYKVNSSTWYLTALVLLSCFSAPAVSAIAVMVLGVADPAAALVGRRFGKTRLRAGRSLEGALTFLVVGTALAFAIASALIPGGLWLHVAVAGTAGIIGAIVEVLSTKVDDNLTIPLAVAASVTATLALFA